MGTVWRALPLFARRLLVVALLVLALLGINAWVESEGFDPYVEGILILCGINAILAVALNIVNGFTGQFSLGHIGFYMVGAYVAGAIATYGHDRLFPFLPTGNGEVGPVGVGMGAYPLLLLCLAGGLAAAVIGLIVGLPSLRLRGDYLAIITLGFASIIQVLIRNVKAVKGDTAFHDITRHGADIAIPHLAGFFWVFLLLAATIWVAYGLRFSTHGLALLAIREDEIAAEAMGINTTKYKVFAFVLSAFFTGVAGALFALSQTTLANEQFSFVRSIDTVVMVVLGGLGSISGVALAAVGLTVLPEALRPIAEYRLVVYSLLLVVLMLTRPQGIFGREEFSRAWLRGQRAAFRGWFGKRRAPQPALATGADVMQTSRDREDTERPPGPE